MRFDWDEDFEDTMHDAEALLIKYAREDAPEAAALQHRILAAGFLLVVERLSRIEDEINSIRFGEGTKAT